VIGRRHRERARTQARALWLDAVRIAEQAGSLDFRADPVLHSRISQICREAIADAFDAVWARKPTAADPAIRDATAALDEWARFRQRHWESERQPTPPSAAAHVLVAPSLAELTLASVRDDGMLDLGEMYEAAELASQRTLLRLARYFATDGGCEGPLDELLELDDSDLRYALEGIAVHRKLWRVAGDLRWLDAARALQATAGGPDGGR
jgi:hypothetical protein